ncbi:MAG: hypothetical protein A3D16_21920 [Rhodobacterales bacterium RIFCSPHIGHO2_02_FULL_62_130]|nr:MAG: hypothetical protein A3D16_21920 [Rhodobacterales bacterium RIFCSPHIGHO2_02_FULL_62_130]OHC57422.1 MAG: hypothetical protein A3E48_17380 [Rhodobacterales bacterium RIFCSPHIGHO2_12_FULL_62_75]HCZ01218.1 hypothetical protein [Rhodobacter sp.]
MFRVDRAQNRLSRLVQKRFSDLNLRERDHLQEWLANQPDALGEELLIIQKEFDGFDETRERLDLLALDKDGNLVVIENKLDDSGRDVTWQALKYTAYVSGLTKTQIVDIYQQYLDRFCGGGNAVARLCEFMEVEDLGEIHLNPGNDQRMIFIAANFRREVTATVLWLLSRGIKAQCFKVTPFMLGEELILDIQQIIPTPEAADFMIGMSTKDNEEKVTHDTQKQRHKLRYEFWEAALERLRADGVEIYRNISPARNHWLSAGSGVRSCPYQMIFSRDEARVELNFGRSEASENKWLFDQLYAQKDQLEARFGAPMTWRRMDENKQSLIVYSEPFDGYNRDAWPQIIEWLSTHIQKLESTFRDPLARLNRQVRNHDEEEA